MYACTHSFITWTQAHTYMHVHTHPSHEHTYMHVHTHSSHEHRHIHICMYILIHHMNTGTHIYACTHSFITWTKAYTYMHVHTTHCIVPWVHKYTQTQLKMNSKLKIGKFWCERVNAKLYPWIQKLYQNEVTKKKNLHDFGDSLSLVLEKVSSGWAPVFLVTQFGQQAF